MYRYPALFIVILIFAYNLAVDIPEDKPENAMVSADKGCFIYSKKGFIGRIFECLPNPFSFIKYLR